MIKFLLQPLYPIWISQVFGENKACYKIVNGRYQVVGVPDASVCPTGYSSLYKDCGMLGHNGLDFVCPRWKPIFASTSGKVVEVCTEESRGLGIGILTEKKYYCDETGKEEYFKYRNWHLISLYVHTGDYVNEGDIIGEADSTGASSGDHDHYELKPVSFSTSYADVKDENLVNILQDNGYKGAINPLPYMKKLYITKNLEYLKSDPEVKTLQLMLKLLGYFPKEQTCTEFYGPLTKKAVFDYQKDWVQLGYMDKYIYQGWHCGPKTRAKINSVLVY
jgi:murein DD-endopeptidase MepM/ murein hydrolase activator NlpD